MQGKSHVEVKQEHIGKRSKLAKKRDFLLRETKLDAEQKAI